MFLVFRWVRLINVLGLWLMDLMILLIIGRYCWVFMVWFICILLNIEFMVLVEWFMMVVVCFSFCVSVMCWGVVGGGGGDVWVCVVVGMCGVVVFMLLFLLMLISMVGMLLFCSVFRLVGLVSRNLVF